MAVTLNASTSSGLVQTADTSGTVEIQSNGTTKLTVSSSGVNIGQMNGGAITSGTAVTLTNQTSVDFTSIPSWVKRITINFSGVSTNGTSIPLLQLGDSGGVETSGYLGSGSSVLDGSATAVVLQTTGFGIGGGMLATVIFHGAIQINLLNATANTWCASGVLGRSDVACVFNCGGAKSLSATLDRVRITTTNGTDQFDAGTINILYEG